MTTVNINNVLEEREKDYGSPYDSFSFISKLWDKYLEEVGNHPYQLNRIRLTPLDVAHMMILLKISRSMTGTPKDDNYIDISGYAQCAQEILKQTETNYNNKGEK